MTNFLPIRLCLDVIHLYALDMIIQTGLISFGNIITESLQLFCLSENVQLIRLVLCMQLTQIIPVVNK